MSGSAIRLAAEQLAARLPRLTLSAQRLTPTAQNGPHAARKGGGGDTFWQYRPYTPGEDTRAIDWRRSARSENTMVNEREWDAPQTLSLWRDPSAGMDWSSNPEHPTKAFIADTVLTAFALLAAKAGERLAVAGFAGRITGIDDIGPILAIGHDPALNPKPHASALLLTDGLEDLDTWRIRLSTLTAVGIHGVIVLVNDPAELDFPYRGAVAFSDIAQAAMRLLGRAESARSAYQTAFAEQRAALKMLIGRYGWRVVEIRTDHDLTISSLAIGDALSMRS